VNQGVVSPNQLPNPPADVEPIDGSHDAMLAWVRQTLPAELKGFADDPEGGWDRLEAEVVRRSKI